MLAPFKTGITFSSTPPATPTAALDAPLDAAVFTQGANVNLAATVADNFNTITKVQFLGDGGVIAEDSTAPYSAVWSAPALGAHTVAARVVFSGNTASSATANITIDTPFGVWKRTKFGANYNNPAIAGDLVDSDFDAMNTLLEYATNTDPALASSVARPTFTLEPPDATLTYRRQLAATDITFSIEQATMLTAWSAVTPTEQILSDDGLTRVIKAKVPTGGATMKMLRLKVTRP